MNARTYRQPTALERDFLRLVTRGYPEFEAQVEHCKIDDYDPDGWCYVRCTEGPQRNARPADGPAWCTDIVECSPGDEIQNAV